MKNALRDSAAGRNKVLDGFLVANGSVGMAARRKKNVSQVLAHFLKQEVMVTQSDT